MTEHKLKELMSKSAQAHTEILKHCDEELKRGVSIFNNTDMITKEQVEAAEKRVAEAEKAIREDKELIEQYNMQVKQNLLREFADIINRSGINPHQTKIAVDRIEVRRDAPKYCASRPAAPHFEVVLNCIAFNE